MLWALVGWANEMGLMGYPWAFLTGLQWNSKNLTKQNYNYISLQTIKLNN